MSHHHHEHERHHGRHHQYEEEIRRPEMVYYGEPAIQRPDLYALEYERAMQERKHHKQMEHVGEMGAVAAGAFAMSSPTVPDHRVAAMWSGVVQLFLITKLPLHSSMYEVYEAKKDPEHAHKHTVEAEIAAAAAVGATGYAFYEHQQAKESHGQKHHHHHH